MVLVLRGFQSRANTVKHALHRHLGVHIDHLASQLLRCKERLRRL